MIHMQLVALLMSTMSMVLLGRGSDEFPEAADGVLQSPIDTTDDSLGQCLQF